MVENKLKKKIVIHMKKQITFCQFAVPPREDIPSSLGNY
jgi:hypothetical protein